MPSLIDIHDSKSIDALRAKLRIEPQRLRRLRTVYFKKCLGYQAALAELPVDVREDFGKRVDFRSLAVHSRHDSQQDGATRLVLRTSAGYLIESVILRTGTGRVSLCLSSQVGCAANCDFCATGKMGIAQNLSAAEILDQIVLAGEILAEEQLSVRNLVFMGMGEPFHNESALYDVLSALRDPQLFHWPASRILVSTVGIPEAMIRCARRFPEVNLALSLHSVRRDVRERLVPLAVKHKLDELREAIAILNQVQNKSVMVEYLMLAGLNDSPADAHQLADWLTGLNVHVNLIPYNPIEGAPHLASTDRAGRDAFAAILKQTGLSTTIRYSLGADVAAACGQLVQNENREVARQANAVVS